MKDLLLGCFHHVQAGVVWNLIFKLEDHQGMFTGPCPKFVRGETCFPYFRLIFVVWGMHTEYTLCIMSHFFIPKNWLQKLFDLYIRVVPKGNV